MKKLAMIGCGGIGSYHLGHFVNFKDIVELAGFCDLIPEKAQGFVEKAGSGKAYTDYKVMLDEVQPDLVFVCIPPTCHGEIEFELIARGIPFFVEKPVAKDLELAKSIRNAVKEKGLITATGFQCRYSDINDPAIAFVKNHPIVFIDCARIGGVPMVWWWRKRSTSLGQIVEQTIHQFDLIRYIFGEPETVFTFGTKGFVTEVEGYDTEDASTTAVKFKNGVIGSISTGCYAKSGAAFDGKITFSARDSRAELYLASKLNIYGIKPDEEAAQDTAVIKGDGNLARSAKEGRIEYANSVDYGTICDRTFIEAVLSGDPADAAKIRSPYEDAVKSLAFTLACNQSMDTGLPVNVDFD